MAMQRFDQINVIPFIDIMLVLLAIVLTTASFVSQGLIEVNLPKAEKSVTPTTGNETYLQIAINHKNQLYIKETLTSYAELDKHLDDIPKSQLIVLRIDKSVVFEHFVTLIDHLKARELNNLSIQTEQ